MYNCEKYIERCIASLLKQTYKEIEIIIVDDGSTDGSSEIVQQIQTINDKIRYIYQENSGPGAARNNAIDLSKGEYLLFVDADDYLAEDYVFDLVACAEENQSELVLAGFTFVYENKKKTKEIVPLYYKQNVNEEWAYKLSLCCCRLYSSAFWKTNSLKFNTNRKARAEDVPIALFTNAMARNISVVQNSGYFYFQHQDSAMNRVRKRKERVVFEFPYEAFSDMFQQIKTMQFMNSKSFFSVGILKFLAHFKFVIYIRAPYSEKKRYKRYIDSVLGECIPKIIKDWKECRVSIGFPVFHKVAIQLLVWDLQSSLLVGQMKEKYAKR